MIEKSGVSRHRKKLMSTFYEISGKFVINNAMKSDFGSGVGRCIS